MYERPPTAWKDYAGKVQDSLTRIGFSSACKHSDVQKCLQIITLIRTWISHIREIELRIDGPAPVAQWIEQWFPKPCVACSNHAVPNKTRLKSTKNDCFNKNLRYNLWVGGMDLIS